MRFTINLKQFMQILPQDDVHPAVARLFKHNFTVNFLDNAIWMFGDNFSSISTILPVFVSTLTDSPIILGLIPAIINAGWFLPQLFMANRVQHSPSRFALARKLALFERVPYIFFPILALMINRIPTPAVLWIFIILIIWRGLASGLTALPWQMVIAAVIPMSHRSRFFGVSRLAGQVLGVVGSAVAALIFDRMAYPYNYALCFLIGFLAISVSYIFFAMSKDPKAEDASSQDQISPEPAPENNWASYKTILKQDLNFRNYLASRSCYFIGNMASGFLAVYGIQKFALSESQAAIFTGLIFASGIAGYALWGSVGDRIGPRRIMLVSCLVWIAALAVAMVASSFWFYYLVFLLLGLASAGFNLGDLVLVMELGREEQQATYLGLARSLPGIFLLVAPIFAGWIVGKTSYPFMFGLAIAFSVLSFAFMLRVKDRQRIYRSE